MARLRNVIGGMTASLVVAFVLFLGVLLAQQAPADNSDNSNFDFSVYFTGNVRGNLEPCG